MAKASKQDIQIAKYQISKLYDEFKEQDAKDAPYGFEICYDTLINNEQTSNPSGIRLRGAELFKQKCESLIDDDYCVKIDVILFKGTSAKAQRVGSRTIFKRTINQSEDNNQVPVINQEDGLNKLADLVSHRLGLAGIANNDRTSPSSTELDFVRKESGFSQRLLEIQFENKLERLTDKLENKELEIQNLKERIQSLKDQVQELEEENENLFNQNEENIEIIKKYAPAKILQNTLANLGTSFLLKFTNNNPKIKETLGALLEDYMDTDNSDSGATSSAGAPPPVTVQSVESDENKNTNFTDEQIRILQYIEGLTNEIKQLNVKQLRDFDLMWSAFKKDYVNVMKFINENYK